MPDLISSAPPPDAAQRPPLTVDPAPVVTHDNSPTVFHYRLNLSASLPSPTATPSQLVFTNATQGQKTTQSLTITAPSASDKILVSIVSDSSQGMFSASFPKTLTLPGSFGGHSPTGAAPTPTTETIYTPTASASRQGDEVKLDVFFLPTGLATDYTASIVIQGDGWAPVTISVVGSVTQAASAPTSPPPTVLCGSACGPLYIAQGGSARVQIYLLSSYCACTVQVEYDPDPASKIGLSMTPLTVDLPSGREVYTYLTFQAEANALLTDASAPLTIWADCPTGSCAVTGLVVQIVPGPVTVTPVHTSANFTCEYPGSVLVNIALTGQATSVTFGFGNGPYGMMVNGALNTFSLGDAEAAQFLVLIEVTDAVQLCLDGTPLNLTWSAYDGALTGDVEVTAYVYNIFPRQQQQETEWCWAATTIATLDYYNPKSSLTQCQLVGIMHSQQESMEDACARPQDFNFPDNLGSSFEQVQIFAAFFSAPAEYSNVAGPISAGQLESELTAGRPVGIGIQWSQGKTPTDYSPIGHAIVASNWDQGDLIVINDPASGVYGISYATLVNDYLGSGIWIGAYLTAPPPPPSAS